MDKILNQAEIDYKYRINPSGPDLDNNVTSNETEVDLVIGELSMTKTVDKQYTTIGDVLTYTIVLQNSGNILLSNIVFTDVIPSGATFITSSVTVNGTSQPTYNPNTGFNLGSMLIGATITVTFQATVTSLPTPNTINNKASTTFNYLVIIPITGSSESNTVTTTINVTNLEVTKSSDISAAKSGDTITYTIEIENTGNVIATNVIFNDVVDSNTTFVAGSVTVNGTSQPTYNPNTGFNLPNINPGETVTVTFEVTVN